MLVVKSACGVVTRVAVLDFGISRIWDAATPLEPEIRLQITCVSPFPLFQHDRNQTLAVPLTRIAPVAQQQAAAAFPLFFRHRSRSRDYAQHARPATKGGSA
jgi:hypothetical protein